jgi:hypothetical protein
MNTLYTLKQRQNEHSVYKITTVKWTLCTQNNNDKMLFAVVILYIECLFCRCYFVYRLFILSSLFCVQSVLFAIVILCTDCSFCRCYFVYRVFFLPLLFLYRVFILSLLYCVQSVHFVHSVHKITTTKWTLCIKNNNDKMNTLYTK